MFIGAEKLTHTYMPATPFARNALNGVSFNVSEGEFVLLLGPSGSGKTTLIQHLNGLLSPTGGRVFFDGREVGKNKQDLLRLRRRVGLVFQLPEEQFFSETVFDEVAFAARNLGLDDDEVKKRVYEALEKVGLPAETLVNRHPFKLSAGQKRLVAVASILSLKPDVMVFDEPAAGLDLAGRKNLFSLLAALNREEGLTVIISTHHLDEVAVLAAKVLVLNKGRLVLEGSADQVFSQHDQLRELGLGLPPLAEIMLDLTARGYKTGKIVCTLQEARQNIKRLFKVVY